MLVKNEHNNPFISMNALSYDLSDARVKKLNENMVEDGDKIVLLLDEKYCEEIPTTVKERGDLEFWEIDSISDEFPFEEYCKLEKKRISEIDKHVRDLVDRID